MRSRARAFLFVLYKMAVYAARRVRGPAAALGLNALRPRSEAIPPSLYLSVAATEGIRFHFGQSGEDAVLWRLFEGKTEGFYVDVGAFHPRKASNTYLLHKFWGWRGINIDPAPEAIARFERERPDDIHLTCAVGTQPEDARPFWVFDYPGYNTLSPENLARQETRGAARLQEERRVRVRPLADILAEHLPAGQVIDVLDIDAEGADLDALRSNDWAVYRPRVVLVEDYALAAEGWEASAIYAYLRDQGYQWVSHCYDTSIYRDARLAPEVLTGPGGARPRRVVYDEVLAVYEDALDLAAAHPEWQRIADDLLAALRDGHARR